MATFIVVSEEDNPLLAAKIAQEFKGEYFTLREDSQWLVEAEKTTPEVSDALDIKSDTYGRAVGFAISNFHGWHKRSLWVWLELAESKAISLTAFIRG